MKFIKYTFLICIKDLAKHPSENLCMYTINVLLYKLHLSTTFKMSEVINTSIYNHNILIINLFIYCTNLNIN